VTLLVLTACAFPDLEASWYLQNPYDKNHNPDAEIDPVIYIGLLNRGADTVHVKCVAINPAGAGWHWSPPPTSGYLQPGMLMAIPLTQFKPEPGRCVVPIDVQVGYSEPYGILRHKVFPAHHGSMMPNRLPDGWLEGCYGTGAAPASSAASAGPPCAP